MNSARSPNKIVPSPLKANGGALIEVRPKPRNKEAARLKKLERETKRRVREVRDRSCYEELESLESRYRERRRIRVKVVRQKTPPPIEQIIPEAPKLVTMGQRMTSILKPRPKVSYKLTPTAAKAVKALGITNRQVTRLLRIYMQMDYEKQNQINKDDFWNGMGAKRTPYTDKIFEMVDLDDSGMMDFSEFVCVLSTFCIFNRDDVLRFSFDCFDSDGSGSITEDEVEKLVDMMQAENPMFLANIELAKEALRSDSDGEIDYLEFRTLNDRFPLMLQPAFKLQSKLHEMTLGMDDWVVVMENVHHAVLERAELKAHFGMPVRRHGVMGPVARTLGFQRSYPRIDIDYISSMRPSLRGLHQNLEAEEEADRDALQAKQEELESAQKKKKKNTWGGKSKKKTGSASPSLPLLADEDSAVETEEDVSPRTAFTRKLLTAGSESSPESTTDDLTADISTLSTADDFTIRSASFDGDRSSVVERSASFEEGTLELEN